MKTIILGDIHGDFQVINHLVTTEQPDIIIQCGDFGYWPHQNGWPPADPPLKLGNTKLYWCEGNHEDHEELANITESGQLEVAPNCFYQPRGSILALPDGRNVLFFGGADSTDKESKIEGKSWFSNEIPAANDFEKLDPNQHIDIVVSHTCPSSFVLRRTPPLGYSKVPWLAKADDPTRDILDLILQKYEPAQWFFGHFHIHQVGKFQNTDWMALAVPLDDEETWWAEL
ncbi:metallophosphoesterase family protein [Desulfovibrio gilichinskyi]|uniref:Calcineurin-like phosphoesterase n=1 Tax=Desulfovibrio gilichinskyi TaxID=1519643 RepID=A0A1X7EJ33_9BACT|nr:metallophosphoesterase [Desulfovibrio gilichinskyi]SMF34653.1 Calcineurin-like phosphoesterase [Desulfovibrio gilichinskyi]